MLDPVSGFVPTTSPTTTPKKELDKDSFLKLLTTQLEHQDPVNPSSQEQMFSILAQMGMVEQISGLNQNMQQLLNNSQYGLIGKNVSAVDSKGTPVSGIVDGIVFENKTPFMQINNALVPLDNIQSVVMPRG